MLESGGIDVFWAVFLTFGGVFGAWNIWVAFNPVDPDVIKAYKDAIAEKDKIIKEYEIKLEICLRLNNYDKRETLE